MQDIFQLVSFYLPTMKVRDVQRLEVFSINLNCLYNSNHNYICLPQFVTQIQDVSLATSILFQWAPIIVLATGMNASRTLKSGWNNPVVNQMAIDLHKKMLFSKWYLIRPLVSQHIITHDEPLNEVLSPYSVANMTEIPWFRCSSEALFTYRS